jgi:hypothetical protein
VAAAWNRVSANMISAIVPVGAVTGPIGLGTYQSTIPFVVTAGPCGGRSNVQQVPGWLGLNYRLPAGLMTSSSSPAPPR